MKALMVVALVRGVACSVVAQDAPKIVGEGTPNWLADVVKDARARFKRERRQAPYIREKIVGNPRGAELAKSPKLDVAISKGLAKASEIEAKGIKPKEGAPSPHMEASWVIFEVCGVPVPAPEAGAKAK